MRNKCLFALGLVFAMSLTSIVAFAFSFTGEPDVKNDQQQIVVVNPATESEETTSEQTVSAETEDTTATLQSAGSSLSGSMDWDAEDAYMLANWFDETPQQNSESEANEQTGYICDECGAQISDKVYSYSINKFGNRQDFSGNKELPSS